MTREWIARVHRIGPKGGGLHRLDLEVPSRFPRPKPGNFVMLSAGREPGILLRRPMAVHDFGIVRGKKVVSALIRSAGRGTLALTRLRPGQEISLLGPIGNRFAFPHGKERIAVLAGGIGIAPFLFWWKESPRARRPQIRVYFGFRDRSPLRALADFRRHGCSPLVALECARMGFRGTVVDLFRGGLSSFRPDLVLACGPEKMLQAVLELTSDEKIPCEVSLEAKMACGLGVCLSCVTDLPAGAGCGRYSLVCRDGPIFRLDP